ncbi:MAG: helix-turn-helix domain-containing protein, partial [Anaerolineales bacterium]
MASPPLESFRAAIAAMPPGSLVPRDWLLEQLADSSPGALGSTAPAPSSLADLTIRDLARLFGKRPSTVRAWVERGDFPSAYKLHGKEWRVPASSVQLFQNRQRRAKSDPRLSAWRRVRRSDAASRSESGQDPVTTRSPHGNA